MNENHAKLMPSPEWAAHIQDEVLPLATEGVNLGADLLELGPGPGAATEWLRQRVCGPTPAATPTSSSCAKLSPECGSRR